MSEGSVNFSVNTRLLEPSTEFSLDYRSVDIPSFMITGNVISFNVTDPTMPENVRILRAYINNVDKDYTNEGRIRSISGLDIGQYLARQKFKVECALENPSTTSINTRLNQILTNTDIRIARNQWLLSDIQMSNKYGESNWMCGEFSTKSDALTWLFKQYQKAKGMNRIRWYIDMSGYLRWFERHKRESAIPIFDDNDLVVDMQGNVDATNIVNSILGIGGEDGSIKVKLVDQTSINRYGLMDGDDIVDNQATESELTQMIKEELSLRSKEVYNVTLTMKHYFDVAPGMEFVFPDESDIKDERFTVVGVTLEGTPERHYTTIEMTTDESLINPMNTFEAIKAVVKDVLGDERTRVGEVLEVDYDNKLALVQPYSSETPVVARWV